MTRHSNTSAQGTSDWLMGAVKSNPEGLLLLAAGCALLLRSGASKVSAQTSGQRSASSVGGSQQYNQGNLWAAAGRLWHLGKYFAGRRQRARIRGGC